MCDLTYYDDAKNTNNKRKNGNKKANRAPLSALAFYKKAKLFAGEGRESIVADKIRTKKIASWGECLG